MTDQELKLALAKELPGLILHVSEHVAGKGYDNNWFYWKDASVPEHKTGLLKEVTDREWDWVVRECERKLTKHCDQVNFWKLLPTPTLHATWEQRAEAYFKVKGTANT